MKEGRLKVPPLKTRGAGGVMNDYFRSKGGTAMDIGTRQIWQVAAGDTNRNYADLCLEWDVILNGPGSEGKWPDCREALSNEWGLSSKKLTDIRRFAEEVADGDIVVLRMGTTDILGVGIVVGDYSWNEEFGDIDGWDLQHLRRVRWVWKYNGTPQKFDTYSLKLGDTTQKMDSPDVIDWLKSLPIQDEALNREVIALPVPSNEITINEISEYLFDQGVASSSITNLTGQIDDLIRIAKWYQRSEVKPSESETISYLVIPLLRSLGWTPQKMAVEWNSVDVALFKYLPRKNESLSVVLEAKQKDLSCLSAKSQAQYYAEQDGRETCSRLIVTDGIRYAVYFRDSGIFRSHPEAYLNIVNMREAYPLLHCRGAKEAFLYLSADWKA